VLVQSPGVDARESMSILERATARVEAATLRPAVLESNVVVSALLEHAGRKGLLCMSTHGRTGLARFVLGSTAAGVVDRHIAPVVLVGPLAVEPRPLHDIDVVVEPDEDDRGLVVAHAIHLAGPGSRLHLASVGHQAADLLLAEQRWCEAADLPVDCDVLTGDVADAIVRNAAAHRSGVVVMGTPLVHVVRRAPCPVLVVPMQGGGTHEERRRP
jgi:nucleotide-binding universal stress UspA family protein